MAAARSFGHRLAGLLVSLVLTGSAWAADCRLDSAVCKEGLTSDPYYVAGQTAVVPCKTVSGYSVCLADIGKTCWGKHKSYSCLKPNAVNYCQPFIDAQPACWQTSSQCSQMDTMFGTGCMAFTQTWRCNSPSMPTPANTIRLTDTYTLISSSYDPGPCQSLDNNPNCSIAESQCVSTTPSSPLPAGVDPSQVAPDGCYQKQNTYACLTGHVDTAECDGYASNPNCTQQSFTCTNTVNGQCALEQRTYQCVSQPPKSSTVTNCSGQLFCQNGNCFDTGYQSDPDFARTMALMEASREAGAYGSDAEVFRGFDSRCRIKLFGLANCCKASGGGGGFSNSALIGAAARAGGELLDVGSAYVYDALYDSPTLQQGLGAAINTLSGGAADGLFNPSFSFYGFSFEFLPSQGFVFTGFDPTTLAIQVGLMILQDLMSCEQREQILAMRRGQNLCHEIGTYCSQELKLLVAKICIEHTKSYCCYNSRLARIINEQGRAQVGKSWGGAESPNCSGFTTTEFAAIDFSRVDLSEFTAEIMANIKMPDVGAMGQQIQSSVRQKVQNYYQR